MQRRKTIFEKYIKWNYVDENGYRVWLDKYGDVIKKEDRFGNKIPNLFEIEQEITTMLSQQFSMEIDQKIIEEIINKKLTTKLSEQEIFIEPPKVEFNPNTYRVNAVFRMPTIQQYLTVDINV
jgi:hypothetical protein